MRRYTIEADATTAAGTDAVWRVVADVGTWSGWGPWDSTTRERDGADDPDGAGAIRVMRLGRYTSREEVTAFVPGERLEYALLSGLPLRDYRSLIELTPLPDGGTRLRWRSEFGVRYPGTGRVIQRRLQTFLEDVATRLVRAAERDAVSA